MIKAYDFAYNFPANTYTEISTGAIYTPEQLDAIYPTNKSLTARETFGNSQKWKQ
jgi:hypothetical protein